MMTVQPKFPASRIENAEHALVVARSLADHFRTGALARDRHRELPHEELALYFQSGLGGVTVPEAYGGIALSTATLTELFVILSAADGSIGQIPQNHFYALELLRINGSEEQKTRLYAEVLAGVHLGNALAEFNASAAHHRSTSITARGAAHYINGDKFYATGALFADRIPTLAQGEEGEEYLVFVPRQQPGVTVIDDWSGFGQRTTGSGSVQFRDVNVDPLDIVPFHTAFSRPTPLGPFAQIMHAAIDQGIARAAFNDLLPFVRERARPWPDSQVAHASQDPLSLDRIGRLASRLTAGEALLTLAGEAVDRAQRESHAEHVAQASIAVAKARAWTTEISLEAANLLFELGGARASLAEHQFDRHWRNARTHTLHDPVRWKYPLIGNYVLNGVLPPRRGTI
ncbi:SfnB family sulfur acquisition oxidoreductase [Rosenbergiella collisarenosi]|uniref:SfnB family sulfur acquisition oxidoreductase n=1 Tax=Rosenbergiella collisarenosi TaxID=1544695 RepID=UPI001F4EE5DE|nr:SfnB family sulfur acquisition oxidoreductase [Rosenbergiella collisarenosi]